MNDFLKLIRWKNLVIVILTMALMRYAIMKPVLSRLAVHLYDGTMGTVLLQFPLFDFIMLVAATVFITAGGYVINDYFDIRTDLVNKGKVIVGTRIPRRRAMMWHNVFNIAGVGAGFYVSWKAGFFWLGIIFLIVSGLLYFYSASYKRQFLIGNFIVALLTALVPLLVAFYEWPALYRYYKVTAVELPNISIIFYWVGAFSIFAFITTLTREIVKDIEDFEGDHEFGRNTVPVVLGTTPAKIISMVLAIITIGMLLTTWYFFVRDKITLSYMSVFIVLPLLFAIYFLIAGKEKKHIHYASNMLKMVMVTGVLYSVAVRIIITWNLF